MKGPSLLGPAGYGCRTTRASPEPKPYCPKLPRAGHEQRVSEWYCPKRSVVSVVAIESPHFGHSGIQHPCLPTMSSQCFSSLGCSRYPAGADKEICVEFRTQKCFRGVFPVCWLPAWKSPQSFGFQIWRSVTRSEIPYIHGASSLEAPVCCRVPS